MKPEHPPGPPMTLGNMRGLGVYHLIACHNDACRHSALRRAKCSKYGGKRVDVWACDLGRTPDTRGVRSFFHIRKPEDQKMKRYSLISLSATVLVGLGLLSHNALGQQKSLKDQLVGTWTLASSSEDYQDGRKENSWGSGVEGAINFDGNSHVMLMIIGAADVPAPPGNPPVSKRNVVAYFGTYSVDEAAKTVTYTAERATEPNFEGRARKASVTLNGDELVQVSAPVTIPQGTFNPNIVWKRAK